MGSGGWQPGPNTWAHPFRGENEPIDIDIRKYAIERANGGDWLRVVDARRVPQMADGGVAAVKSGENPESDPLLACSPSVLRSEGTA